MKLVDSPLVSVLMPVYNGEKYLKEAIESILNQTYTNFEFIIINDGSTDCSEEIILSYTDTRINYISNSANIKLIKTLNVGLNAATGKYICRMDADDISVQNRIEVQVDFMENHPEYVLAGTYVNTINELGQLQKTIEYYTQDEDLRFAMIHYCPFIHPSVILRNDILKKTNYHYLEDYIHAEDYHLWTILTNEGKVANIPLYLLNYRVHPEQISSVHEEFQNKQMKLIQEDYLKRLFPFYSLDILSFIFNKDVSSVSIKCDNYLPLTVIKELYAIHFDSAMGRFLLKRWKNLIQGQKAYSIKAIFEIVFSTITWKSSWKFKELLVLLFRIRLF